MEINRQKLHQFINGVDDRKAEAFYILFENEIEEEADEYTDEFKAELDKINDYYENGGERVSTEEVEYQINMLQQTEKLRQNV